MSVALKRFNYYVQVLKLRNPSYGCCKLTQTLQNLTKRREHILQHRDTSIRSSWACKTNSAAGFYLTNNLLSDDLHQNPRFVKRPIDGSRIDVTDETLILKKSYPTIRHAGAKGESKYSACSFLTSALDGGEWSASRPGRFYPRERTPVPIA
jgi:hypothetical protein